MPIKSSRLCASRAGFTLIELLIFAGIFTLSAVAFISILISFTKIQASQSSVSEVTQQSQFLLQTIQRYVESSSVIDIAADSATSTLKLRMSSSTEDPTYIYASGGVFYLKVTDSGTPQALTNNRVAASSVAFTKRTNPPGHDTVAVTFVLALTTSNLQQAFRQSLETSVARVNAATFDSDMMPSTNGSLRIGVSSQTWQSINDLIYFSGSNVGIGANTPAAKLEVNGGLRLYTATSKPTCDSSARGTFWVTQNGALAKDNVEVCVKNASDAYIWATIY